MKSMPETLILTIGVTLFATLFVVAVILSIRNRKPNPLSNPEQTTAIYIDDDLYNETVGKFVETLFNKEYLFSALFVIQQSWKSRAIIDEDFYLNLLSNPKECLEFSNSQTLKNPKKYETFKTEFESVINVLFEDAVSPMVFGTLLCMDCEKPFKDALLFAINEWKEEPNGVLA